MGGGCYNDVHSIQGLNSTRGKRLANKWPNSYGYARKRTVDTRFEKVKMVVISGWERLLGSLFH